MLTSPARERVLAWGGWLSSSKIKPVLCATSGDGEMMEMTALRFEHPIAFAESSAIRAGSRIAMSFLGCVMMLFGASPAHATKLLKKSDTISNRSLKSRAAGQIQVASVAANATTQVGLIQMRAQSVLTELKRRPLRAAGLGDHKIEVASGLSKNEWLEAVYRAKMVDASFATQMLSDKRIFAEVLQREMGPRSQQYYPRTMGLKEFLVKWKLVDGKGQITADGDQVEAALLEEFPAGFLARPAVGVAPHETTRGLYPNADLFIAELVRPGSVLYSPAHFNHPVRSHILNAVASGEAIVLQENFMNNVKTALTNVVSTAVTSAKSPHKGPYFQQVRIHTYEDRVVDGAVPARWVQVNLLSGAQIHKAETFVGEFLLNLPIAILNRQAWGVDVAVLESGEMRIIDVVTNRGEQIAWSGYLDQPRVIAAYAQHFDENYSMRLTGLSGALIRHGFANYLPFWSKRIEKATPGLSKALAYLPPMP